MKSTLLWGILIASTMKLYAQVPLMGDIYLTAKVDSLKATLPSKKGLERLSTLLSLGKSTFLWKIGHDTTYLHQIQQELKRYPGAQGHYRYFKAHQNEKKNNSENIFLESKAAYNFYKTQQDSVGMVSALLNMATVSELGTKGTAKRQGGLYLKEMMQLSQYTVNPELQLLHCYALVRFLSRDSLSIKSNQVIPEIEKALRITKQYPQYEAYAPVLLNFFVIIYESRHEYAKAQQMTLEVINTYRKNTGSAPIETLVNLGLSYENQQKYAEAEKVYREAMEVARKEEKLYVCMDISIGMHASLVGQKKYREAAPWADSIYTYAEKYTIKNTKTKTNELAIAYEVEKKEAANKILQQEKELTEARSRLYVGVGIAMLAALLGVSFLMYRLRRNNAKLQTAYNEILKLNQARDYFFGIIAHDLRRPLSSFQDMAGMINYYLQQKRYGELDKVSQSIDQMGRNIRLLLDNLLSWALSQREEVPHHPERLLLCEKIHNIVALYQQIAQYRKVELIVNCPQELTVYMDPNACELIIRNLMDNALKNAHTGGKIQLIVQESAEGDIKLTVEDDGKGMSEEKLASIRQTLQHPDLRTDRPRGLGMILLGRFLKSNHIDVDVSSTLGIGTRFLMSIPMHNA